MFNKKAIYITGVVILSFIYSVVFPSCSGAEPDDPNSEKIEQLKQKVEKLSPEVRTAFVVAKSTPINITPTFDGSFNTEANRLGITPMNIVDSSRAIVPAVDSIIKYFPTIDNAENLRMLQNKAKTLYLTYDEWQALLNNSR